MRRLLLLAVAGALAAGETVVVPLVLTPIAEGEDGQRSWTCLRGGRPPEQVLWWAGRPLLFQWRDGELRWDADGNLRIDAADGAPLTEGAIIAPTAALGGAQVPVPLRVSLKEEIELLGEHALVGSWAGRRIALLDNHIDGRWDTWDDDLLLHEQDGVWRELDELRPRMLIDGAVWAVAVDHAQPALRLTREHPAMTTVTVGGGNPDHLGLTLGTCISLRSADGRMLVDLHQGQEPVSLPVGDYRIHQAQLGLDGITYRLDWSHDAAGAVSLRSPTRLVLQAPQRLEAVVVAAGADGFILDHLALVAADGMRWRATVERETFGRTVPLVPTWSLRGAGRELPLGKLEYG